MQNKIEKYEDMMIKNYYKSSDEYESSDECSISSDEVDYEEGECDFKGEILNDRYAIIFKIGSGSYSSVWLSYDIEDKKMYAIKIQFSGDYQEGIEEVKFMKSISKHPCDNINIILESFVVIKQKQKYLCMKFELMAGSLFDIVAQGKYSDGLSYDIVRSITKQIVMGLDVIHNSMNCIHADLKPENILFTGVSIKLREIIDEFMEKDFHSIYSDLRNKYIKSKDLYI